MKSLFNYRVLALMAGFALLTSVAHSEEGSNGGTTPTIKLLTVPNLPPNPDDMGPFDGKASAANLKDCKVVLYARGDKWYVQPWIDSPETVIQADGSFSSTTHGGFEYAALLVKRSYVPAKTLTRLPAVGGDVLAIGYAKPDPAKK
jgi:hypothetical protein